MSGADLLLLRHPPVSRHFAGRCYGSTDVALSREGLAVARVLADGLADRRFAAVYASPLRRARLPAARLAASLGIPLQVESRLAERCFGAWEGRTWDAIWAEEGDAMNGSLDAPDSYRPGGGETTTELADRVLAWFHALPPAPALAVTHGGPIAALAGRLRHEPPRAWLRYTPAPGLGLQISPDGPGWRIAAWPEHSGNRDGYA